MLNDEQKKTLAVWTGEYVNHQYIKPMFEAYWKTETIRKKLIQVDRYDLAKLVIDESIIPKFRWKPLWRDLYYNNQEEILHFIAHSIDYNLNKNFKKWAKKLRNQDVSDNVIQQFEYKYEKTQDYLTKGFKLALEKDDFNTDKIEG